MDNDLLSRLNYKLSECTNKLNEQINNIKTDAARRGVLNSSYTLKNLLATFEEKGKSFINEAFEDIVNYFSLRGKMPDMSAEHVIFDYLKNGVDDLGGKIEKEVTRLGKVPDYYYKEIEKLKNSIATLLEIKFNDLKYSIKKEPKTTFFGQGMRVNGFESNFAKK